MCGEKMTPEEREYAKKNKEIERQLAKMEKEESQVNKLLLLGAGESGKSTIFKQMMILYGEKQEAKAEMTNVEKTVYMNILTAIQTVIEQAEDWGIAIGADTSAVTAANKDQDVIDESLAGAIAAVWADAKTKEVWHRRAEFQVVESMEYFFNKIDEIGKSDYKATKDDHLHTRVRTTGVVTKTFIVPPGARFEMYDVGGQRNERKKWIHCFQDVTAVIFVAAISEYDQSLLEDATTNRMEEALELFGEVCDLEWFYSSAIILFLNKRDLFEAKLAESPINNVQYYKDYTGGADYEAAREYFLNKFLEKNRNEDRTVYYHITCATDTENVHSVWEDCKDIILDQNIQGSGF